MTQQDRQAEIRARVEAATDSVWVGGGLVVKSDRGVIARCPPPNTDGVFECAQNTSFIAHARQDVPWLLDRVRELLEQLAAAQAERDAARREAAQMKRKCEDWGGMYIVAAERAQNTEHRLMALQRESDRRREALVTYGHHRPLCAVVGGYDAPCDCGFSAALAEPEAGNCVEPDAPWTECIYCGKKLKTCEIQSDVALDDYRCPVHREGIEVDGRWICSDEACQDKLDRETEESEVGKKEGSDDAE